MSLSIVRTLLNGAAHGGGALDDIMRSAEHSEALIQAIRDGNVADVLGEMAEAGVRGADELAASPQFMRFTTRIGTKFDELEGLQGALMAGDDIGADVLRIMDIDAASDLGRAITGRFDEVTTAARAAMEAGTGDVDARLRAIEEMLRAGGDAAPAAANSGGIRILGRPVTWGGIALTTVAGASAMYVYAGIEEATGGALARGAVEAIFNEAERRIEEGVDLEEVFADLRDNADLVQFIMDPTNNARQQGLMQGAYAAWENRLDGAEPTAADITTLKTAALTTYMSQEGLSFALHSSLIRWEVGELLERGEITEDEVSEVYVDRFSAFLAENLDYSVLSENGYTITAEDVEGILRTDPNITGRIMNDLPTEDAAMFVHGMPEIGGHFPGITAFIERGGLRDGEIDPERAEDRIRRLAEGPGALMGALDDPSAAMGAVLGRAGEDFNRMSGAVIDGMQNIGMSENSSRIVLGLMAFFAVWGAGSRLIGDREGITGAGMSLGVWTAAIGAMTAIFNGGSPEEAFSVNTGLEPDTAESVELERMALGGYSAPALAGEEPGDAAPVMGGEVVDPEARAGIEEALTTQLRELAGAMDDFHAEGLGPSGEEVTAALDAGNLELAAQLAHRNLETLKESFPEEMEGRAAIIESTTTQQLAIQQYATALGYSIDGAAAVPSVAEEFEAEPDLTGHSSFGVILDPTRLPTGEELDAYQEVIYRTIDVTSGYGTYMDDPSLALSIAADIEEALIAGDTERAANIAYEGLDSLEGATLAGYTPAGDAEYLAGRLQEQRQALAAGAAELGITIEAAPAPAPVETAAGVDVDLDAGDPRIPVMGNAS